MCLCQRCTCLKWEPPPPALYLCTELSLPALLEGPALCQCIGRKNPRTDTLNASTSASSVSVFFIFLATMARSSERLVLITANVGHHVAEPCTLMKPWSTRGPRNPLVIHTELEHQELQIQPETVAARPGHRGLSSQHQSLPRFARSAGASLTEPRRTALQQN